MLPLGVCVTSCRGENTLLVLSLNDDGELEPQVIRGVSGGKYICYAAVFRRDGHLYLICVSRTACEFRIYEIIGDEIIQICRYTDGALYAERYVPSEPIDIYMHRDEPTVVLTSDGNIFYVGVGIEIVCVDLALLLLLRVVNVGSRVLDICVRDGRVYFIRVKMEDAVFPREYIEIIRPFIVFQVGLPFFIYTVTDTVIQAYCMYIDMRFNIPIRETTNSGLLESPIHLEDNECDKRIDVSWTEAADDIMAKIGGSEMILRINGVEYIHTLPVTNYYHAYMILNADRGICGRRFG